MSEYEAGFAAAIKAAALIVDCGCAEPIKARVASERPNSPGRWIACRDPGCPHLDACAILALRPVTFPETGVSECEKDAGA